MNLLVSDFDETLYTNFLSFVFSAKNIKQFREDGNLFVIATARSYRSITYMMNKFHIPYDYLICLNGSSIFDQEGVLLKEYPFNKEELEIIKRLMEEYRQPKVITSHTAYDWHDKNHDISGYQVSSTNPFALYDLGYYIKRELPHIGLKYDVFRLQIKRVPTNKSTGIEFLNHSLQVPTQNIYTIGDYINDLEMIRDYNGFHTFIHHPSLNKHALGCYFTVDALIKDISEGKALQRTK